MKIRKGFVSNSSSSSFVCDICGTSEGGYDANARDVGMINCENGHTFCEGHFVITADMRDRLATRMKKEGEVSPEEIDEFLEAWDSEQPKSEYAVRSLLEDYSGFEDISYELPAEMCPICNMTNITGDAIISYIDKFIITKKEVINQIRSKVSTYEELQALLAK